VTEVRGLTQAAVSLPMKGLEEALGAELFDRTGRGMRLNAEGGLALRCAKEIPSLYAGVREEMDPEGGVRGVS
jgi:DNA-binding transcriptional LysR family regulator